MLTAPWPRFQSAGDAALVVELGAAIDPALNGLVHALDRRLLAAALPGIVETVPTYASILVHYDPLQLTASAVRDWVAAALERFEAESAAPARLVEIPTVYGGEAGPDLDFVAQAHGLSPRDVVRLHSGAEYRVYMMGFLPGFAYLGGLPHELATPRLASPRPRIPAGSVGIAGEQTGVYPLASPGGWRLIGRTALRLFAPEQSPPTVLRPGDHVRFVPVEPAEAAHGA